MPSKAPENTKAKTPPNNGSFLARKAAVMLIYEANMTGESFEKILEKHTEKYPKYTYTILCGIEQNIDQIEQNIKAKSKNWQFDRIKKVIQAILYIGIWEINFNNVPQGLAIAEAIKLGKMFADNDCIKYINGVLG